MIKACCNNERLKDGYKLYEKYTKMGIVNKETYVILFTGLSNVWLIDKVVNIWERDIRKPHIKYDTKVMNALIDALAKKRYVYAAYEYINEYNKRYKDKDVVMYTALLNGCRESGNKCLAEFVGKEIANIELDDNRKTSIDRLMCSVREISDA